MERDLVPVLSTERLKTKGMTSYDPHPLTPPSLLHVPLVHPLLFEG